MKPSREQINQILDIQEKFHKDMEGFSIAIEKLTSSYPPIFDFHEPLDMVKILLPEIYEILEYYYYECPLIDRGTIFMDKKEYPLVYGDRKQLKDILVAFKYLK